jgi:hypothetical protein
MNILLKEFKTLIQSDFPSYQDEEGIASILDPVDQGSIQLLSEIRSGSTKFNPLHIEPLLDEAIQHLNICLQLRQTTQQLEEQAISDIMNFDFLKKEWLIDSELNQLYRVPEFSKILSKQSKLNRTNSYITANEDSSTSVRDFEAKILDKETDKMNLKKQRAENIKELRGVSGSAFNLVERFNLSKQIFNIHLKEAYARLKSVAFGIKEVYGLGLLPLPDITDTGYLNKLYVYAIEVLNSVNNMLQLEQEFLISIPLKQGYQKGRTLIPIFAGNDFVTQRTAGTLIFNMPGAITEGYRYVRMRSMKISVRWDTAVAAADRWNFTVKLPRQVDTSGNLLWDIPKYNCVGLMASNPGYIYEPLRDLSFYNCSILGEWTIQLPEKSNRGNVLTDVKCEDIWLELIVSARIM